MSYFTICEVNENNREVNIEKEADLVSCDAMDLILEYILKSKNKENIKLEWYNDNIELIASIVPEREDFWNRLTIGVVVDNKEEYLERLTNALNKDILKLKKIKTEFSLKLVNNEILSKEEDIVAAYFDILNEIKKVVNKNDLSLAWYRTTGKNSQIVSFTENNIDPRIFNIDSHFKILSDKLKRALE